LALRTDGSAIVLDIKAVPRASRDRLGPWMEGDVLKVQLTAPPVEGAANEALRTFLAKALGVGRAAVSIVRGETCRKKTVRIEGVDEATLRAVVNQG
jgi:uncharacterized protein (TIGR00251 family)